MNVSIFNCQHRQKINLRFLKQIAEALLAELKIQNAELEINLVATDEMTQLNETFLRHKGSTDVITFDYTNQGGQRVVAAKKIRATTKRCPPLHGEIFISVDEAACQAREFHSSWPSEIVRYVIHGVLHLLGYDDRYSAGRRRMKREEDRLLRRISRRFSLAQLAGPIRLGA